MIEGAIFLVLALTGLRYKIVRLIPEPVRIATPAGIGAFLAHLGLQSAEGIGVVVGDIATAVTLGGCPEDKRVYLVAYDDACANDGICLTSDNYTCDNGAEWMVSICCDAVSPRRWEYSYLMPFLFQIALDLWNYLDWYSGHDDYCNFVSLQEQDGLHLWCRPRYYH
jgi:hypothetical protein